MAVSRTATSTTKRLRSGAHDGVDAVADSLDSLRSSATDYVDQGRERATELAQSFEESIRERPVMAILIGTAIGFVVGCMIARR